MTPEEVIATFQYYVKWLKQQGIVGGCPADVMHLIAAILTSGTGSPPP